MAPRANRTSWRFGWHRHLGRKGAITPFWPRAATSFRDLPFRTAPPVNCLATRPVLNFCYSLHQCVLVLCPLLPTVNTVLHPSLRPKGECHVSIGSPRSPKISNQRPTAFSDR